VKKPIDNPAFKRHNLPAMTNRKKAIQLINRKVTAICGLSLDCLADTCIVAEWIDEIESMIESGDPEKEIIAAVKTAAHEILEDEGFHIEELA
jgi:hypothetical protein